MRPIGCQTWAIKRRVLSGIEGYARTTKVSRTLCHAYDLWVVAGEI